MEQYSTAYFQKLDLLSSLYAGQVALKDSLPTEKVKGWSAINKLKRRLQN